MVLSELDQLEREWWSKKKINPLNIIVHVRYQLLSHVCTCILLCKKCSYNNYPQYFDLRIISY